MMQTNLSFHRGAVSIFRGHGKKRNMPGAGELCKAGRLPLQGKSPTCRYLVLLFLKVEIKGLLPVKQLN